MSTKKVLVDGTDPPPFPLPALREKFNLRALAPCKSEYRRLHINCRTSQFKFSSQMERSVKMPLKPGRGLMDWIRLCQQNPNMGTPDGKPIRVTEKEMAEHFERDNAWMIINGKVYNVAPYMEYHPGGIDQLMRAAGTDGTKLFNEKHPWVNYESMLKSCFVGYFAGSTSKLKSPAKEPLDMRKLTLGPGSSAAGPSNFLNLPGQVQYPKSLVDLGVNCTWKEDGEGVQVLLDTPWRTFSIEQAVVECVNRCKLRVLFRATQPSWEIIWSLPSEIDPSSIKASSSLITPGRLSVSLQKQDAAIVWPEFLHDCVVRPSQERKYRSCRLYKIDPVTHDSRLFTIDFPDGDYFQVPVGSHVFVRIQGTERPYTPVTWLGLQSNGVRTAKLQVMIKVYDAGKLTQELWKMKEDDTLEISDHEGSFSVNKFLDQYRIFLLAAGTGFTPMTQIIQHCLQKPKKHVTLVFFNKTEKDILWREELEKLAEQSDRFQLVNVLSEPDATWTGRKGRVSSEILSQFLLPINDSNFVCVCGPSGFTEACLLCLKDMGYQDAHVHAFQG